MSGIGANNGSGSGVSAANDVSSLVPGLPDTGAAPDAVVSRFRAVLLGGVGLYVLTAIGVGLALAPRR